MSIQVGDRVPEVTLKQIVPNGIETVDTRTLFDGRNIVVFAVPGAFTPTCSERHLPGFVKLFDEFRQRGVLVACMAVNDPFVMQAWAKSKDVPPDMLFVADGNGDFTRALGLEFDGSSYGMGWRSKRFAMYVENGVVKQLYIEEPGAFSVSTAENVLEHLPAEPEPPQPVQ